MPLEDLTGNKYLDDLNESWPLGTDLPDAGDDHLRGIKNVLKKTFPNVAGPITLTDAEINRGSIPLGSVTVFYQATAPAGWVRVENMTQTFGLRIVASATAGGVGGGTDDPIVNDKVAAHTHDMNFSTGTESADHSHAFSGATGYMNQNSSHAHGVSDPGHAHGLGVVLGDNNNDNAAMPAASNGVGVVNWYPNTNGAGTGISIAGTDTNHTHNFSGGTGGRNVAHSHVVSGATGNNNGAVNWTPRYLDMILCRRGS